MATSPEPTRSRAGASGTGPDPPTVLVSRKASAPPKSPADRRWLLAVGAVLVLHLGHPLTWHRPAPGLWLPAAGVGVALVAWLGARAAVLVALDGMLLALQTWLVGLPGAEGSTRPALAAALAAPVLGAEVWLAWWVYRRAGGARGLGDPTSAALFLLVAPGLIAGLFAPVHALLCCLPRPEALATFGYEVSACWVSHALGILGLAPPLLVGLTPWLIRRGLVPPERPGEHGASEIVVPLARGDWIELGGLTLAAAILGALLALAGGRSEALGWLLGGLALLLVTWASLSQHLRGGSLVAATVAVVSLGFAVGLRGGAVPILPLQGQLLALSSSALLVGASAGWVGAREARYRQVVARVPMVLYSGRVLQPGEVGAPPRAAELIFVSAASRQMLGCEPEGLLGDYGRWLARVHPEDRELVTAALAQLCRQDQSVTCEYRLAGATASLRPGDRTAADAVMHRTWEGQQAEGALAPPSVSDHRWVRDTLAPRYGPGGQLVGWEGIVVDITEQRHLAASLRRTTSMFHALVAHLPAGVFFVHGPSGWPILVNARARELLGNYDSAAVDLAHLVEFYGLHRPDGTPYPTEDLPVSRALRLGMTTMRDDIVVHRPDGRKAPLITWAAPIDLTGHGQADAAVWVFEDLTALRQAEAAHRESEARLRAVIEAMAEGLVVCDREGRVSQCNPAACTLFGLPAERLRGRSLFDPDWVTLREDGTRLPSAEHPARVSLETGEPVRGVLLGFPEGMAADVPAERVRWVLVNAMPLWRRPEQLPTQVVTTFADVTAARRTLDVLRASEEKYRGLVETLPIMLAQADRDLRITYVNPALESITGYTLSELQEPGFWQSRVQPDSLPPLLAAVSEIMAGHTRALEIQFRARDGAQKVGHAILQPRYQDREIVGAAALIVDMTVQRRLEEELRRAQRLEVVGRLASGIAHDFNNMLTVVLTLTEMAHDTLPADHPVREDLRRVAEAGEQAANLAAQLLAFSRQRRVEAARVDVNAVAGRTLELLRGTLLANITLEPSLGEGDLNVQADETQLQQVLMNLCLNARDAMPKGGRLDVRTEAVPTPDGRPEWVRLSVQDSGEGIDADTRARLFTPFFSTKEHGTGLGLAVAQQIVESYGGRIEVWSQPGEGTRFDVWLLKK